MSATHGRLLYALDTGDFEALPVDQPMDERDELRSLLTIYASPRFRDHPRIARFKWRLEEMLISCFDSQGVHDHLAPLDVADAIHGLARKANASIHDWLATSADWAQLTTFIAIDSCDQQVVLDACVTRDSGLPISALYRWALDGLLANPSLRPEELGARALHELQDGPRCGRIVAGFRRLGARSETYAPFAERAESARHHLDEWLHDAMRPLRYEHPDCRERVLRGARWRAEADARLYRDLHTLLATREFVSA